MKDSKMVSSSKTIHSFWTGIAYSLIASLGLSFISAFLLSQNSHGLFQIWALVAWFITLLGVVFIGIPVVLALKEFNKDTWLNAGLSGGFITFLMMLGLSGASMGWLSYVSIFYGFVCGFAFMYGVKQDSEE